MSNILPILKKFDLTKADIVKKYQKDGRKIIGCSPYHLPVELVYASGMRPMGLWGRVFSGILLLYSSENFGIVSKWHF